MISKQAEKDDGSLSLSRVGDDDSGWDTGVEKRLLGDDVLVSIVLEEKNR
jgi:hypothetical protein